MQMDECCSTQLIDGDGLFSVMALLHFPRLLSWMIADFLMPWFPSVCFKRKSKPLNYLLRTNFREMDAFRGIWMAKCADIEPCTLVMDLEGTDGRKRRGMPEDYTAFEKQGALFALAVSDIVLINMWCHDISREQAANKPLFDYIPGTIVLHLFSPCTITLLFVIHMFFADIPEPTQKDTSLSEFLNVEVTALNSYEEKEEQRFYHSIAPGGLAGDRRDVVPASVLSFSAQQLWKIIKENKDLDLPAQKVKVATVQCEEIANEKFAQLVENEVILVPHAWYDMEAIHFDEGVRTANWQYLGTSLLQLVQPAYHSVLGHLRSKTLDDFKDAVEKALKGGAFAVAAHDCTQSFVAEFDKGCAAHVDSVRATKLYEITATYEGKLNKALAEPVESLLDAASSETWPSIRNLFQREMKTAVSGFTGILSGFDISGNTLDEMVANLESVWTEKEDIRGIMKASLKLLSVMAVLRLEDDADSIEKTIRFSLHLWTLILTRKSHHLCFKIFFQASAEKKLITPVQFISLWRQFKTETEYSVFQAIASQEANKRTNNWKPPPWDTSKVMPSPLTLGLIPYLNPLWLLVMFVGFLLVKALWVQLDISGEFRNGAVSIYLWRFKLGFNQSPRDKLHRDTEARVVRGAKLSEITATYEVLELILHFLWRSIGLMIVCEYLYAHGIPLVGRPK
ncbi:hypothetical protein MKW92_025594 [Papaver armeniacum]|nr:hypothetical protein MKW92_025594 [Papaver armeniacum]